MAYCADERPRNERRGSRVALARRASDIIFRSGAEVSRRGVAANKCDTQM